MKKIFIITLIIMILVLTGCDSNKPPDNLKTIGYTTNETPTNCTNKTESQTYYDNISHVQKLCNSTDWVSIPG